MNNFEQLCEEFFTLEEELGLINETIDGVYFWERLRFRVHQHLSDRIQGSSDQAQQGDQYKHYLSGMKLLLKNIFARNPFLSTDSELLFYGKGRRKKLDDGLWWDIYLDPLVESTDRDTVFFERPYKISHQRPTKTPQVRYTDLVQYAGNFAHKTGLSSISLSGEEESILSETNEKIRSRFGVDIPLREMVKEDLALRKVRLKLYNKIIKRTEPQMAFLTVSYNGRETFVEACQSQGVPVVELQHGVINKYHMGYSYPHEQKNVFPDYFFSFGDFWSETVDLPLPEENIFAVGYPYLEKESQKYLGAESKEAVVIISQASVGERLSRFAKRLAKRVDERVIYKLHPNEQGSWKERYPWLRDSDVSVVKDDPPLYQLLSETKHQIGVNSTALYEGIYFGLDTFIIEAPGSEYMDYLINNDYATAVTSVDEYLSKQEDETRTQVDVQFFFEEEPIKNFNRIVEELTGEPL